MVDILKEWNLNVSELFKFMLFQFSKVFYIASPPTEGTFISRLVKQIEKIGPFRGYSGADLTKNLDACLSSDPQGKSGL